MNAKQPSCTATRSGTLATVRRDLILLVAVTIGVRGLAAWPMEHPGYMDAAYYVDGALSLYEGNDLTLPFIWNYLAGDMAAELPAPSHLYWMPLTSLLIHLSFLALGPTFRAAQIPSIVLSTGLPLLVYLVAFRTSVTLCPEQLRRARHHARFAGLLATFSGFYTIYWVTLDSFALFAVTGGLCLWALGHAWESTRNRTLWFAAAGLCAGVAHLARADGVLLVLIGLLPGGGVLARLLARKESQRSGPRLWVSLTLFLAGYLAVMAPWFARNMRVIGRPLSTTGLQTIWLTDYDDLFSYSKALTLRSYLDWGWANILRSKLWALWQNAQTVLIVGWMIALAPFGLLGAWRLRRQTAFQLAALYGILLYLAMSLVFTFPGWRGGMLHSTVALLPTLYTAAIEGLDGFVRWMASRRSTWQVGQAKQVFSAGLIVLAIGLSAWLYATNLDRFRGPHIYDRAADWLNVHAGDDARVMVNDPPSFYYYSRMASLPIPNGDLDAVLHVMQAYHADYLLLDSNNVSLQALYRQPGSDERLTRVQTFRDETRTAHLFKRAPGTTD